MRNLCNLRNLCDIVQCSKFSRPNKANRLFVFLATRRCIIIAACVLIAMGYVLMSGPGSTATSFNPDIFSTRRIVVAPALCLAGYLLMIVGILRK